MKKMLALSAGLLAGSVLLAAPSQAQVYSQNAVGYIKTEVERGKLVMLRNDFEAMDGNPNTPSKLFGSSLPVDTKIYVWDTGINNYVISTYKVEVGPPPGFVTSTNWSPNTLNLDRGVGFWLQIPASAPQTNYTVYMMGEVPMDTQATLPIDDGLNLISYMYPVDVVWTNTALAQSAVLEDAVYLWDQGIQNYVINRYRSQVGPPPAFITTTNWSVPSMVIPAGRAFWFITTQSNSWTEVKPYQYP